MPTTFRFVCAATTRTTCLLFIITLKVFHPRICLSFPKRGIRSNSLHGAIFYNLLLRLKRLKVNVVSSFTLQWRPNVWPTKSLNLLVVVDKADTIWLYIALKTNITCNLHFRSKATECSESISWGKGEIRFVVSYWRHIVEVNTLTTMCSQQ